MKKRDIVVIVALAVALILIGVVATKFVIDATKPQKPRMQGVVVGQAIVAPSDSGIDVGTAPGAQFPSDPIEGQANSAIGFCGNGIVDVGEECDGTQLNNSSCFSLGYYSGNLSCTPLCLFDINACLRCGDGICHAEWNETITSCAIDCNASIPDNACGNGVCEQGFGEDSATCPSDCPLPVIDEEDDDLETEGESPTSSIESNAPSSTASTAGFVQICRDPDDPFSDAVWIQRSQMSDRDRLFSDGCGLNVAQSPASNDYREGIIAALIQRFLFGSG